MTLEVVQYLATDDGILVYVCHTGKGEFVPFHIMHFMLNRTVELAHFAGASLDEVVRNLHKWDSELRVLPDGLGDFPLWEKRDGAGHICAVYTRRTRVYTERVGARDVPVRTFLAGLAFDLFALWLGAEAVDAQTRELVKQPE